MDIKKLISLAIEAIVVGFILVVVGTLVSYMVGKYFSVSLPPVCKEWNKNRVMELSLFLSGVLTHLLFELVGGNTWYCKNGVACQIIKL